MKKLILFAMFVFCCLGTKAAGNRGILYLKSPANYQITAISANGEWACGAYLDASSTAYGFRWNLKTGKIEATGNACSPTGISNDGVLVGSFSTTVEGAGKIEVAGTWDGSWTMLELPNKKGCWANAISPDGQYVVGVDNSYTSYLWKNGKVYKNLKSQLYNTVYCVSNDGSLAGGWAYNPYTNKNRTSIYWDTSDGIANYITPDLGGQPWMAVKKFTPDNKKALFWGGYTIDPNAPEKGYGMRAILDLETRDTTYIYPTEEDPFNFDFYDMSADGKVVGMQQDLEGAEHAFIYADGKSMMLQDYLESLGADFSDKGMYELDENEYYIARGIAMSSDAKAYGLLYYGDDLETTGNFYSMVVLLDQDLTHTAPVNVAATQVTGILTAQVSWDEPLGDISTLLGYDIYRDGTKLNTDVITDSEYYDQNLEEGTYTYNVVAVYDDGESEHSADASIEIEEEKIHAPRNFTTRQRGYADGYATWQQPATNLIDKNYYSTGTSTVEGFGGGDVSFESGTLFPAKQMNLYDSYRLTAVSFYPLTEQGSWIINVYTHNDDGSLLSLGSFPIKQELNYGVKNTVTLSRQITLQKDHDLIIGIQTNVTQATYNVQGVFAGCMNVGYSDLIRQVGEENFYSINEKSAGGVGTYDMSWGTAALLAPAGVSTDIDKIDHYEVSVNGWVPEEITETHYTYNNLSEGEYNFSVTAVYANGENSDWVDSYLTIKKNDAALKAVTPVVKTLDKNVTATWTAPKDDDATTLAYCGDNVADLCPNATDDVNEFYARIDYKAKETIPYNGYEIKSLSFLPMSESTYYVQLNANDDLVYECSPEEVTVGEWNTIELDEPVIIDCDKTYHFVIDCYDCPSGEAPLAIDNYNATNDYSSMMLVKGDEDYGWSDVYYYSGLNGNWMMKMNIAAMDATDFNIEGYDVYLDNQKVSDLQTSLVYNTTVSYKDLHSLRVDAHYATPKKVVTGNDVWFQAMEEDAIDEVKTENAKSVELFNTLGQRVNGNVKGIIISRNKKYIQK